VAVVVDPIQSVKGKVVIDAFRTINPQLVMMGQEPRQTTSNIGHLQKPSIQVLFVVPSINLILFLTVLWLRRWFTDSTDIIIRSQLSTARMSSSR